MSCHRSVPHAPGRSTLGWTETDDVEAALMFAVERGAERIVLFGWSMGAAIALNVARTSRYASRVSGLVLDSPVLSWWETIAANCTRAGLPRVAGRFAIPWLTSSTLAQLLGLPHPVPIDDMSYRAWASDFSVPVLILHGERDVSVPIGPSEALSTLRPYLVTLVRFDAGHTLSWNSDTDRWTREVGTWLDWLSRGA
ncbi:MAG: alpha/beta hydrolase [Microbacterium gubbeenense]